MPTFLFFIHGQKVDEMKGADPASLQQKIQQWALQSNQSVSNWVIHSTSRSSFNGQNLMSYPILLLPEVNFPPPLPPPPQDSRNFLCGGSVNLFWNNPLLGHFTKHP
jgi:hypothetical protein